MASTIVLNSGSNQVARSLISSTVLPATSYQVSETAGATVNYSATGVDTAVYTGSQDYITVTQQATQSLRYTLEIPAEAGPFKVGNIMLFATGDLGSIAFIHDIMDTALEKVVGTRMLLNITVDVQDLNSTLTPTVTAPVLAQLPTYTSEASLPAASAGTWQSAIIQKHSVITRPVLVSRYPTENVWYGNWLWQKLSDEYFGCINGGVVGDGFIES